MNPKSESSAMSLTRCMQDQVVVTGAGREIALLAAIEGAKVVVNDLGGGEHRASRA